MRALLDVSNLSITTPGGRPLFNGLNLRLANDHVALIGRNGVGKSTLLSVLAEQERQPANTHYVPQLLPTNGRSHGQARRLALEAARTSGAEMLLLDEPTEDLDEEGLAWLRRWLLAWKGGLVVASHDRRLLQDFRHFFLASEAGCRYFAGSLHALDEEIERDHRESQERYASHLHRLTSYEEHTLRVARRKGRKKRAGRCRELDRCTSRARLNLKRDQAQDSHGRLARMREGRLGAMRSFCKSTRRALKVDLSIDLPVPVLPEPTGDVIVLHDVSDLRTGFRIADLRVRRERIAVVGPNGAGKTTLLDIMLGNRPTATGKAFRERSKVGAIEQGGANWMLDESLVGHLSRVAGDGTEVAKVLVAHRFPLALAERPLRSLSPGERARAALLCLFHTEGLEVLVLDEPTYSLDLVGQRAMVDALRAWPGGLVVASHDREFLARIGVGAVVDVG